MTINALGNRTAATDSPQGPLAIGQDEQEIFNCPGCARPLAVGTRRCPGCRTLLVMEVRLRRVARFVSLGLAVGLVAGAVAGAGTMLTIARSATVATVSVVDPAQPQASDATAGGAAASPRPTATVAPLAISALRQASSVNHALVDSGEALHDLLHADEVDAGRIAKLLRRLAKEAVFGLGVITRLDGWPDAGPVAEDLDALYSRVRATARQGLKASLHDEPAYKAAAGKMLAVIDGIADIDAAGRTLAESVGVELPAMKPTGFAKGH
jgi:hypothetical protein